MPTLIELAQAAENNREYDDGGHWYTVAYLSQDLRKLSELDSNDVRYWVLRTHVTDAITDNLVNEKLLRGKYERGQEVEFFYRRLLDALREKEKIFRE